MHTHKRVHIKYIPPKLFCSTVSLFKIQFPYGLLQKSPKALKCSNSNTEKRTVG